MVHECGWGQEWQTWDPLGTPMAPAWGQEQPCWVGVPGLPANRQHVPLPLPGRARAGCPLPPAALHCLSAGALGGLSLPWPGRAARSCLVPEAAAGAQPGLGGPCPKGLGGQVRVSLLPSRPSRGDAAGRGCEGVGRCSLLIGLRGVAHVGASGAGWGRAVIGSRRWRCGTPLGGGAHLQRGCDWRGARPSPPGCGVIGLAR